MLLGASVGAAEPAAEPPPRYRLQASQVTPDAARVHRYSVRADGAQAADGRYELRVRTYAHPRRDKALAGQVERFEARRDDGLFARQVLQRSTLPLRDGGPKILRDSSRVFANFMS